MNKARGAPELKRAPETMFLEFLEFKALDETQGTFNGYLAVKNNIDNGKDRVKDGAFLRTINSWLQKMGKGQWMPVLWQHDPEDPIGGFTTMREDEKGLYVEGFLDTDIEQGKRAYSGLKKGYLRGLSMGYETKRAQFAEGGIRDLHEVRLWEGSVVTFAMNEEAGVEDIKGAAERKERSLNDVLWAVDEAVRNIERVPYENYPEDTYARYYPWRTFSSYVVAEDNLSTGQLYKIPYVIDDTGTVRLGDMEPVQLDFKPMVKSLMDRGLTEKDAQKVTATACWLAETKAGRRNSVADVQHIHSAMKSMMNLMDSPGMAPMMEHMSSLMKPEDLGPCMQQMASRLDDTQRGALLLALHPPDSGSGSKSAPAPAAAGNHADETKGAHSDGGPADPDPALEQMAREVFELLQKAAAKPSQAATTSDAETLTLLASAARIPIK